MIHFYDLAQAASVFAEKQINKFIIPLSADTLSDNNIFRSIAGKYPDLEGKFKQAVSARTPKSGDSIKIQLQSGHVVFCIIIRPIEKFQASVFDMIKALNRTLDMIQKEIDENSTTKCNVMFPLPTYDELKLSDSIFLPAIADTVHVPFVDVHLFTNADFDSYVEKVTEEAVYYRQDSWKSDWMFSNDDMIFFCALITVVSVMPEYRLNKANLVRCYYVCNQNGMFPKLEFYQSEYGPFFKQFLMKSNSLVNHNLLANVFHYTPADQKKFSCILGPAIPHLMHMAYSYMASQRQKIKQIADAIRADYFTNLKAKSEEASKQQTAKPADNNRFNF